MRKLYTTEEEKKKAKQEENRKYKLKNKELLKVKKAAYYSINKEEISFARKEQYAKNPHQARQRSLEWKQKNKAKHNANCMKRYASKMKATPPWLTLSDYASIAKYYEIAKGYTEVTKEKWHVDHIIPLQGKDVCGLHVPWNLQVIPASINCSKKNNYERRSN